ncbi:hypothetical protein [Lysinibacillus xylanilyticus]|uniref:hypothetical protein n=1 Tax=Lysinibacillus xylanilyticus TaxID=582475 RepID=UPI003CFFB129
MTAKIEISEITYRKLMDFVARHFLCTYAYRKMDHTELTFGDLDTWIEFKGDHRFDEVFDLLGEDNADSSLVTDFLHATPDDRPKLVRKILRLYTVKPD